jgi:predicted tellurium resistance membrane protein TerC
MSRSTFSTLVLMFAFLTAMIGLGILVTDMPLRNLCQKHCWLNYFLYSVAGETGGKLVLSILWAVGAIFIGLASISIRKGSRTHE